MKSIGFGGRKSSRGNLALSVIHGGRTSSLPGIILPRKELLKFAEPRPGLPDEVNAWRESNKPLLAKQIFYLDELEALEAKHGWKFPFFYGRLALNVGRCQCGDPDSHPWSAFMRRLRDEGFRGNKHEAGLGAGLHPSCPKASWFDYGLASLFVITDTGVAFLVDAFQNTTELENVEFHGIGTGTTAADQTDTSLETELTTQYNPNNTRATGSNTEGASANIYRTVGTNTVDASAAITEHGILTQAATGGGTLWDRHVFSAINLGNGDSLQSTYDSTFNANG